MEIEVKYRLGDTRAAALEAALAAAGGTLSEPVHQDDQAYAESGWDYGQSKIGRTFARLRTQDGRHLFTVKTVVDNAQACLEHETEVADRDQMHRAVLAMGFTPTVRIVKTRRTACVNATTICLDDVRHAGVFVEFERTVTSGESATRVQRDLDAFARSLGLELTRTTDTYDSLVRAACR